MKKLVARITTAALLAVGLVTFQGAPASASDFHSCSGTTQSGFSCSRSGNTIWLYMDGTYVGKVSFANQWLHVIDCKADGIGVQARVDPGDGNVDVYSDKNGSEGAFCWYANGEKNVETYFVGPIRKFRARWGSHGTNWAVPN